MQRNTFSPDELVKIADMLDMKIAFVDKNADIEAKQYVIS